MTAELVAAALLVALAVALELSLRLTGFGSFPLFERDEASVYRMRPNQAGCFRDRFAWNYDANGMRNDRTPSAFAETGVLVGDSIVDGGIGIDQGETLAAQATRLSGQAFYGVAAPGWALANELAALADLPGWERATRLIFVLNTGDFYTVATMGNELSFPTRRPVWLTLWIVRRHMYRRFRIFRRFGKASNTASHPPVDRIEDMHAINLASFATLLGRYAGPVWLVRYPMRGEDARAEVFFEELASLDARIRIVELAEADDWGDDCYADHIHPNARGLEVLARHLCKGLC